VNNDGYYDILLSSSTENSNDGLVYLFYGGSSLPQTLAVDSADVTIPGRTGLGLQLKLIGKSLGDINGDSFDDFAVSETTAGPNGTLYVIFGGSNLPSVIDITTLDGNNGFSIVGDVGEVVGLSITGGDFNHDGYQDIAVACQARVVVLFNYRYVWPATILLSDTTRYISVLPSAVNQDLEGEIDLNGDTVDDLLGSVIYALKVVYGAAGDIPGVPSLSATPSRTSTPTPSTTPTPTTTPTLTPSPFPTPSTSEMHSDSSVAASTSVQLDNKPRKTRSTHTPTRARHNSEVPSPSIHKEENSAPPGVSYSLSTAIAALSVCILTIRWVR